MNILLQSINLFFTLLTITIIGRVLMSWISPDPYHPLARFLSRVTEPILAPIRRIVPPLGMVDISPIIAIIVLQVIQGIIVATLRATQ